MNDHPLEREVIARCLGTEGFVALHARDYQSAVKILDERVPSIVCLNIHLPRESGYDLCTHIRAERRLQWVPILVMSDRPSPEQMAFAEEVGANAFLKKPFSDDRLIKYVAAVLDGPMASRPSVRRLQRSQPPPRDDAD